MQSQRCESVPEPLIDAPFRGPEDRHRLAGGAHIVQLPAHHLRGETPPAMARKDPDDGDAGGRDLSSTRDREAEREGSRGPDDRVAIEGGDGAVDL